jgi:ribosomal protein S18 acetylase RimI-like enzyme
VRQGNAKRTVGSHRLTLDLAKGSSGTGSGHRIPCVHLATIASVDKGDEAKVIATLVSAFIADPVERWLFAEPLQYLTQFARFVAAFGSGGFESETVFSLGDFAAVAIWIPPGAEPDADAIAAVLSESVPTAQQADTFSVLEQMDAAHPKDLHWYLPWLGVDSARQGAGLGAELLKQCLARVDADHLPAFLETPNPRTVPFYEGHGFVVTSVSQAGACPPVTSMRRPAG